MIKKRLVLFAFLMGLVFAFNCWAVPAQINYQGRLEGTAGPVNDTVTITFRLHGAGSGGTPLWEEEQGVLVLQGIYNVILGTGTLNTDYDTLEAALLLTDELWLEVHIEGEADPMAPRQKITSVGFAVRSGVADTVPDGSITDVQLATDAVTRKNFLTVL